MLSIMGLIKSSLLCLTPWLGVFTFLLPTFPRWYAYR